MIADTRGPPEKDPETGRFLTGNSGGGRGKGSRNRLGEKFLLDLHADWQDYGIEAIREVRETKPAEYLKVVASLLPRTMDVAVTAIDEMSDEQIIARLRQLEASLRPFLDAPGRR